MVHALEEIRHMLKPDGALVDIHPVLEAPRIQVHQGRKILFDEPDPDHDEEKFRRADRALEEVLQRGLFILERRGQFDMYGYSTTVAEYCNYIEKASGYDESPEDEAILAQEADFYSRVEAIMEGAGEGAEIVYHEVARIMRLRPD